MKKTSLLNNLELQESDFAYWVSCLPLSFLFWMPLLTAIHSSIQISCASKCPPEIHSNGLERFFEQKRKMYMFKNSSFWFMFAEESKDEEEIFKIPSQSVTSRKHLFFHIALCLTEWKQARTVQLLFMFTSEISELGLVPLTETFCRA